MIQMIFMHLQMLEADTFVDVDASTTGDLHEANTGGDANASPSP